jgi:hypothetical protein
MQLHFINPCAITTYAIRARAAPCPKSLRGKNLYQLHYIYIKKYNRPKPIAFNYFLPDRNEIAIPARNAIIIIQSSPHNCGGLFFLSGLRAMNDQGE